MLHSQFPRWFCCYGGSHTTRSACQSLNHLLAFLTPRLSIQRKYVCLLTAADTALNVALDIQNKEAFSREFKTLDQLTSVLTASLSDATAALSRDDHALLVACTIARAASIQLHARFVRLRADSRERCLSSARIIAASVQGPQAGELYAVDPVMAVSHSFMIYR